MFVVIYRFKLKPEQEADYLSCWRKIANYFKTYRGALGSRLHKGEDGLWVAYSHWPDRKTRDASWPNDKNVNEVLPVDIQDTIKKMLQFKEENKDLESYEEICLELVEDLLLPS